MKVNSGSGQKDSRLWMLGLLAIVLSMLFWRSFLPDYVHFSNDGPLGQENSAWRQMPAAMFGGWYDLTDIGGNAGSLPPSVTNLLFMLLGPVGFEKFFAPMALFILGLGAWTFFRTLKLSPLAAALGMLAAVLNSTFFASACWGVGPQQVAMGMDFFALALVVANTAETPQLVRWVRFALAGLCVGMNVIEAADIGALFSMLLAAFVFYQSLVEKNGSVIARTIRGAGRVTVLAIFAGFIAYQTVIALTGSYIQGAKGTAQDTETKAQHWDWATQWSLPKQETLGLIVPGLFGYKMDTPKDMMPNLFFIPIAKAYEGGLYWGGVGRDPVLDRYFDGGSQGLPPQSSFMRFTGGGNYCGILVLLIAAWAVSQSFRRQNSIFPDAQKKLIWFWAALLIISVPLAWGRFAPFSKSSNDFLFYAFLYKLPYFSTIRNPAKFLIFVSWASVILFAYGIHALNRRYLDGTAAKSFSLTDQVKSWWAKAGGFDRRWTQICAGLLGASVIAWLIYAGQKPVLVEYLSKVGFQNTEPGLANYAPLIAGFSIAQAGWFLLLFAAALALVTLAIAGYFNGPRAKLGAGLLGAFLLFDMGRADLPYVIHWDYKQKYEVGTLNPIGTFLRDKPYEHRVAKLLARPLTTPSDFGLFDQLYDIEWTQHHFLYYDIQCLDVIQSSREATDLAAYEDALRIGIKQNTAGQWMLDETTFPKLTRKWELTNTRYLLGPAPFLGTFNTQFDPGRNRFRIIQRFDVAPKPGILQPTRLEELTAVPNENGVNALYEFTGALPRAKLYSHWQVSTNDEATLKTLADQNFDPQQTVLLATNLPVATSTNQNAGTVDFASYSINHIKFKAQANAPSVLLFNDRYDPNWKVFVDGQPAGLLRCNFIMRGVYVPPGAHTVEFLFTLPQKPLYITVAALGVAAILGAVLFVLTRRTK